MKKKELFKKVKTTADEISGEAVKAARIEYSNQRKLEDDELIYNVEFESTRRAALAMIECKIPKDKIIYQLGKQWNLSPSEAEKRYEAAERKLFIQRKKKEAERQKQIEQKNKDNKK